MSLANRTFDSTHLRLSLVNRSFTDEDPGLGRNVWFIWPRHHPTSSWLVELPQFLVCNFHKWMHPFHVYLQVLQKTTLELHSESDNIGHTGLSTLKPGKPLRVKFLPLQKWTKCCILYMYVTLLCYYYSLPFILHYSMSLSRQSWCIILCISNENYLL